MINKNSSIKLTKRRSKNPDEKWHNNGKLQYNILQQLLTYYGFNELYIFIGKLLYNIIII